MMIDLQKAYHKQNIERTLHNPINFPLTPGLDELAMLVPNLRYLESGTGVGCRRVVYISMHRTPKVSKYQIRRYGSKFGYGYLDRLIILLKSLSLIIIIILASSNILIVVANNYYITIFLLN